MSFWVYLPSVSWTASTRSLQIWYARSARSTRGMIWSMSGFLLRDSQLAVSFRIRASSWRSSSSSTWLVNRRCAAEGREWGAGCQINHGRRESKGHFAVRLEASFALPYVSLVIHPPPEGRARLISKLQYG